MKLFFTALVVAGLAGASLTFASTPPPPPGTEITPSTSSVAPTTVATPSTLLSVTFPITELGGCASKQACKVYCDVAENKTACLSYAETHGLMDKAKIAVARMLITRQGPGGCTSKEECRAYCADETHREVCYAFAVKNGLRSSEEANRDKSFQAVLKNAGGPGGCATTQSCKEYCADATHAEECRAFAELHGFMRVRAQMASSTNAGSILPMRKLDGSTTSPRTLPLNVKPLGSTTKDRIATSSPFDRPKPPPSPATQTQPSSYVPQTGLGAAVINVLNVFGW